jgi:nucleotide-binding universal stress UspA family protein
VTQRIVIALDTTERSLDPVALGRLLARATGATAVLATVLPYHPAGEELGGRHTEAEQTLRELADSAGMPQAEVEVIGANVAARGLQALSERDETGLIVLGSTRRGPVGRLLVGGTGDRLLTGSACPVAIAPHGYAEGAPGALTRIGVAFDGSDEAQQALDAGIRLAEGSGAALRLITVAQRLAFGAVPPPHTGGLSSNEILRRGLRDSLETARARIPRHIEAEARFLEGSAVEVLSEESEDLDLLVTGSRGYGPRAAVLLGSTTHTLMRTAACPGLVLPRGASLQLGTALRRV